MQQRIPSGLGQWSSGGYLILGRVQLRRRRGHMVDWDLERSLAVTGSDMYTIPTSVSRVVVSRILMEGQILWIVRCRHYEALGSLRRPSKLTITTHQRDLKYIKSSYVRTEVLFTK